MFRIYKGEDVIVEGTSPLSIAGLDPNTDVGKGEYQVTRIDGKRESGRVDVPAFKTLPIEVTGVTIAPKTNNLEVGDTRQLNATVEPSNATNKTVTFESSNNNMATVNGSGLVTAIGEGGATITVKAANSHTDTATVNVTEPEPEE